MVHFILALLTPGLQALVVIDRIEGDIAVVEFVSDGKILNVPISALRGANEGDKILLTFK